jgi:uncharacterized protein
MTAAATTGVPVRDVRTRRIGFDYPTGSLSRHYVDGDLIMSHVVAVLSAMFPEGEDFFVRAVRRHAEQVDDPQLQVQVRGFIGQEVTHGREHRALNERLQQMGYPTRRVDRSTKRGLALYERFAPPMVPLAMTAALEHYTATLAETLLTSERAQALLGDSEVRSMLLWHALEESEHKAVAFDVYKAVGGSERMRVMTMNVLRYGFVMGMTVQVVLSLLGDRDAYRPRVLVASWRRFRRSPLVSRAVWEQLRDYNRPDFHPDDRDTTGLVDTWRTELFGEHGSLKDKLVSTAA